MCGVGFKDIDRVNGKTERIDFCGKYAQLEMAGLSYDNLFENGLPLDDQVVSCPAHGAGSVCGADIRKKTTPL